MSLETIRLSQKAKNRLVELKVRTGIQQWNILCRWALCRSLNEPTAPVVDNLKTDSNVEMTWQTFAGEYADVYRAMLVLTKEPSVELHDHLLAHIHRGIDYLFSEGSKVGGIYELTESTTMSN
jgi:DNA sulfur modification protein DndE